jgi:C4-dicarboxylate-specific signal transduction histidine kinase
MDSQHFEQVLVNLIVNAEQAVAGVPEPAIRVTYGREADQVVLAVGDSGPGIDPAQQEDYFRPFMTTRTGAVGLGLTASRALAQAAGGSLRFIRPSLVELRVPAH